MATIRELQARFTASAQGMRSQINKVRQNISGIGSDTQKAVSRANKNLNEMSDHTQKLEKELKETGNVKAFDELRNSIELAKDELRQTGEISQQTTKRMQRAVQLAKKDYSDLGHSASQSVLDIDRALNQVQQELNQTQNEVEDTERSFEGLGSSIESILGGIVASGGIVGAVQIALDNASLDTTIDLAFNVPEENIEDVRDSIQEVTAVIGDQGDAIEGVRRQFALNADATIEENQAVVKSASLIARTYQNIDFSELIQEANEIANELEISNEEALGLTNSLLKIGFPPEELDIIAEYGQQLYNAGYEAEEIQAIFASGVETGTWNIDNLLDGLKEGRVRLAEFGQEVPDAIGDLLEGTEISAKQLREWGQAVAEGGEEGKEAFEDVAEALLEVEDKTLRNTLGTEIFGTMWEDQGENILETITNMDDHLVDLEDNQESLNNAVENLEDDPVTNLREAMNDLLDASRPVLEVLTDIVNQVADWISQNPKVASRITTVATAVVTLGGAFTALKPIIGAVIGLFGGGRSGLGGTLIRLVSRGGPVGLAVGAVGALVTGIIGVKKANQETIQEIEESFDTRRQELELLSDTAERYGELEEKNKLTREEMEEYIRILGELENSNSEETIAQLRDRQEELREKSGLTNEEMEEFLKHNNDLIEKLPQTTEQINQGKQAYAGTKEEVAELLQLERERSASELYSKIISEADQYKKIIQDQKDLEQEINKINASRSEIVDQQIQYGEIIKDNNEEILDLEEQLLTASGSRKRSIEARIEQLRIENQNHSKLIDQNAELIGEYDTQIAQNETLIEQNQEQLRSYDNMISDYERMSILNIGITDEKGNQVDSIEEANEELRRQLGTAKEQLDTGEISKTQYKDQIELIKQQAREVQNVKKEGETLNRTLGKDIDKTINLNESPSMSLFNSYLSRSVSKRVNITTHSTWFRNQFAEGTNFHPGGLSILGDGRGSNSGSELYQTPDGDIGLSPPYETVMSLPRGTKVWSAKETRKMLGGAISNSLHLVSRYADGIGNTVLSTKRLMNSNQLGWVANGGWAESVMSYNSGNRMGSFDLFNDPVNRYGSNSSSRMVELLERIAVAVEQETNKPIIMNAREVGRVVEPYVTNRQGFQSDRNNQFRG